MDRVIRYLKLSCYSVGCFLLLAFSAKLSADPLPVFVSIPPQKYFVQQIGMDLVRIEVMVKPGANPATYEPKPAQMTDLASARIYFSIGVPFESVWLKRIAAANPKLAIIPTDRGILKRTMTGDHGIEQGNNPRGQKDHRHGMTDPHIWTSPPLVMLQARTILTALQSSDPVNAAVYESNYRDFINDLLSLDADLRQMLSDKKDASFLVFHPSWGYFADAYGLHQIAIEVEGKDPKPAQLKQLISLAKKENIKVVFAQPQFSSRNANVIAAAIGGRVVAADPLAADWEANLRRQARLFRSDSR